ncbi:MAG: DUF4411 family protein [Patescibacteria group bacterium]|nr:DUF4411 family protein [bacterium]
MKNKETKYLLDSNILIGFALWKPMSLELNKFFWNKLSQLLKEKKWFLLDCVVQEIEKTFDQDFKKWCKKQVEDGLVCKNTEDDKKRAISINNSYKMIDDITGKSEVDTYLLAFAERNGLGVFSMEKQKTPTDALFKIPDVCNFLGIKRISKPKAFLESVGFK